MPEHQFRFNSKVYLDSVAEERVYSIKQASQQAIVNEANNMMIKIVKYS